MDLGSRGRHITYIEHCYRPTCWQKGDLMTWAKVVTRW